MSGGPADPGERLAALGLTLPEVPAPVAAYVPAVRTGDHVYTSGQLPFVDGKLPRTGKVGAEVGVDEARELARLCALNALAAVASVAGDLSNIVRVVKVVGYVASAPGTIQLKVRTDARRCRSDRGWRTALGGNRLGVAAQDNGAGAE